MLHKEKKSRHWCDHEGVYSSLGKRRKVRCPKCNRRIVLRAHFESDGSFDCWLIPKHKTKPETTK